SRIFNYCISKEIVDTNPVKIVGFVKNQSKSSRKLQFYTTDQYLKFRGSITDERYLLVFDLLYFTGMRISELQARTWSDLNFDENTLYVHSNYDCKNHVITPSTKNGESRIIYLSDNLMIQLRKRYNEMKRYKNFDSTKFYIISDLSILSQKTISNNKKYILDTYNDSHPDDQLPRIRIHDFRHSHVSMLINSEVDTFTIAERLGHSKQMVENVYGHLFPSKKKEILNVLNNVKITSLA
ncbi:MAG: site-specific integrase, partial [Erysipelotrichaceae bacterium]